jgi:galactofuranosylgalactofuranosylrhamnosyl-N-acetylglucosaminyl-diphospho-decaprenol beta-1,5/1,6-galactofuranosyltransferase
MPDESTAGATTTSDTVRGSLVEHTAPERLVAQRGLFSGPSSLVSADLYVEVDEGIGYRDRSSLRLEPHAHASSNTYFGRFPASYWQRWTAVTEVEVVATVHGQGRMSIVASDMDGVARTVAVRDVTDSGKVSLTAKIDRFVDGGALWVEWETGHERLHVEDMAWTVEPPEKLRPVAAVICTYNRADDCVNTLTAIAEDPAFLQSADAVYVVDQGNDRVDSRPGFAKVTAALGDKLVYITQPNLGGAGGFTRGLYEVTSVAGAEHANVIFMDDDILCEPETIARLNAFANRTVEPAIVGAQMLYLLHPDQLHVGAETADLGNLGAGIAAQNALSADDLTEERQEIRVDAGYNGWWSCLIPAEIVSAVGFPLPLFFQWDDIEYGFRSRAAGFATVTLPGAGVWHADFGWKDWDEWHRYFNIRNALVTSALHSGFQGRQIAKGLLAQLGRYVLCMQYGLAYTLVKAVEDFSRGPEIFTDGGAAAAAEIRKERAAYGETKMHKASDVPGLRAGDASLEPASGPPSLKIPVLAKRILGQALGRVDRRPVAVQAADAHWYHVARFETAVVTDASQEGVRVRRRDPDTAKALLVRGVKAINYLRTHAPALREQYRAAMPEVTSREHWGRLFGQD